MKYIFWLIIISLIILCLILFVDMASQAIRSIAEARMVMP